jgi:sugar phosphate isomerase/epimerase
VKVSLVIAPPEAHASAFVVFRDRLDVSVRKARALGYDGVELALALPSDVDVPTMRGLLAGEGMRLSAVSTGRVFAEQGVWLTHPDESARRRAVEILKGLTDVAVELGAPRVNLGRVRAVLAREKRSRLPRSASSKASQPATGMPSRSVSAS